MTHNITENMDSTTNNDKVGLWQILLKEHLDENNTLTDDEWEEFVDRFSGYFAQKTSELGQEMMEDYKLEIEKDGLLK